MLKYKRKLYTLNHLTTKGTYKKKCVDNSKVDTQCSHYTSVSDNRSKYNMQHDEHRSTQMSMINENSAILGYSEGRKVGRNKSSFALKVTV